MKLTAPGGGEVFIGPHLLLPADKVRHVGEAVAMVVAETKAQALDAAEALVVVYDELPFVLHSEDAMRPARRRYGTRCRTTSWSIPVSATPPRPTALSRRPRTSSPTNFNIGRVTGVPMELRACVANYDAASGRYTLYAGSGGAVRQKRELATLLGIELEIAARHVVRRRRQFRHPQPRLSGIRLGAVGLAQARPPGEISLATRSECFISDYQGRDLVSKLELALDAKGRFLALRATNISNAGARCVSLSPLSARAPG